MSDRDEPKPVGTLTHLDAQGRARMVDVSEKPVSARRAVARGAVVLARETLEAIASGGVPKGDVFATARIAGILGAKRTADLIPLCHPLPVEAVEIDLVPDPIAGRLEIEAVVVVEAKTGIEMEALTAVAIAGLTVIDMVKAIDRGASLVDVRLVEKSGGRSGTWRR